MDQSNKKLDSCKGLNGDTSNPKITNGDTLLQKGSSQEVGAGSEGSFQSVRGTQDFLPPQSQWMRKLEQLAHQTVRLYGYREVLTPIFEFSKVFHRTLGETTDMISKETYTFQDRGGDELTLRPEGTAGIVRAFISNKLYTSLPQKLYYFGPMFRYERPQKGRFRQFHQLGVECLGIESPVADIESIALSWQFLQSLNLGQQVDLEINTLGDSESRSQHRRLLVNYLMDFQNQLSLDSQKRLMKNPLRILDSKDPKDKKIVEGAPSIESCLNSSSMEFFSKVKEGLSSLNVPYKVSPYLVRGIDYYTHTVFEWTSQHLGAQGAVIAGGRYDGLVQQMGGPPTPGFGWASGIERLILLAENELKARLLSEEVQLICVINADEFSFMPSLKLVNDLRNKGYSVEFLSQGKMSKRMSIASKLGAHYALIFGENELNSGTVTIKDLKKGIQKSFSLDLFHSWKSFLEFDVNSGIL